MEAVLIYFGKVILSSGVMFLYYQLFLKDKTFHHYNRFYLLSVLLVSLLLPLLKVSYFTLEVNNDIYLLINKLQNNNNLKTTENAVSYSQLFAVGAGLVSVFLLVRFLMGIFKISQLKKQFPKEQFEGINFYQTDLNNAPFSYFRNLFWKNSILIQSDLGKQILKHEMVHIEQKHSFDKIFVEIIKSVFWFNPFFYLIKKEIHLIHEYLADKKAVKQSDTKAFAQMLLASRFSGEMLPATSPFLSSNLKKRLIMLKKSKTKFSYARKIFALPLLFAIAFIYLVNAKNKEIITTNTEIAKAVQEMKADTVKVKNPTEEMLQKNQEKLKKASEKINKDLERINVLAESSKTKAEELKKIEKEKGTESAAYTEKLKEIEAVGERIDKIANSDKFKLNIIDFEKNAKEFEKHFNNPKTQKKFREMAEQFNNPETQKKFKEFQELFKQNSEMFNSKEWQDKVKSLKNLNIDISDIAFGEDATELFQKHPEIFFKSEKTKIDFDKAKLSPENAKKLEKIAKEKEKLAKKQAELARQQEELMKKEKQFNKKNGEDKDVKVLRIPLSQTYSSSAIFTKPDSKKTVGSVITFFRNTEKEEGDDSLIGKKIKVYYLNGEEISYDDLVKNYSVQQIKSVQIKKNGEEKTMHIETR